MEELELDERKTKILNAIIRNYLETGEPVGSRTISKYTDLNLSSATIRNEMADLEELGYILQPHTSAGRIPSDKGYRFYVDHLMEEKDREVKEMKDFVIEKTEKMDQVLKQIAEDFKLKTGSLANTGYSIPSMIEDGQTLFDIVLKAIDYTLINTGKMFVLWDNFGKLTLTDVETAKLDLFVGDGSLATGFTYESEIDSEAYNKIKLVKDNKKTGKRDVYIFQDSKNMTLWGILQDYEVVSENMNEAQIKKRGGQMLELYNRPKRSFSVSAIADLSVRAGRALYIGIGAVGVKSFFIVEEATHDLLKETMSLKLKVV